MILGVLIIVVIGIVIINLLGQSKKGETIPPIGTEETGITLPTTHIVTKGEDLWKISEKYYKSGYNWTDIASANEIANPNIIEEGTELTIPDVTPKLINKAQVEESPTPILSQNETNVTSPSAVNASAITGDHYTVVKGDNLWKIAVRAYGDGYKWVDISKSNSLKNPNLIHSGNEFVIPR